MIEQPVQSPVVRGSMFCLKIKKKVKVAGALKVEGVMV